MLIFLHPFDRYTPMKERNPHGSDLLQKKLYRTICIGGISTEKNPHHSHKYTSLTSQLSKVFQTASRHATSNSNGAIRNSCRICVRSFAVYLCMCVKYMAAHQLYTKNSRFPPV